VGSRWFEGLKVSSCFTTDKASAAAAGQLGVDLLGFATLTQTLPAALA
jgi:hypothetical protein